MDQHMEVQIDTPFIKLDQILKYAQVVSSGGEAKEIIKEGLVKVNGDVCLMRGKKIVSEDIISFGDITIKIV